MQYYCTCHKTHLKTEHCCTHICLCSQMSPVADPDGCLRWTGPKRYAGHAYLLLDNLGGCKERKSTGKMLLPALQQYGMADRSGVIRSSTGTGYLVLHTVDERALHLTNALACTFDQGSSVSSWTTEVSAGSETMVSQKTHSLFHKYCKVLRRCGRVGKTPQTEAEAVEQLTILKLGHPYPPLPVLPFPVIR